MNMYISLSLVRNLLKHKHWAIVGLLTFQVMAWSGVSVAEEEPKDPLVVELEKQKEIAVLKKEIAEAEDAARKAGLPDTETTGLEGEVELGDGAGYYAELQAYATLKMAAKDIAEEAKTCSKVIVTDQSDVALKQQVWNLINNRLTWFDTEFENILSVTEDIDSPEDLGGKETAIGLVASLPTVLGGVADIVKFFKTDVTMKNRTVELAEKALIAEVGNKIGEKTVIPDLNFRGVGHLVQQLNDLGNLRRSVVERKEHLRKLMKPSLDELQAKRQSLAAKKAELARLRQQDAPDAARTRNLEGQISMLDGEIFTLSQVKSEWDKLSQEFDALTTAYDQYQKGITERSGDKPAPLGALALIDVLKAHPAACRLAMAIASQGAEVHLAKSIWTSGRVTYLGGSVVTYFLFDKDDELLSAGMIPNWLSASFKAKKGPR